MSSVGFYKRPHVTGSDRKKKIIIITAEGGFERELRRLQERMIEGGKDIVRGSPNVKAGAHTSVQK